MLSALAVTVAVMIAMSCLQPWLRFAIFVLGIAAASPACRGALPAPAIVEAITFDAEPGQLYLPAVEAARLLRWKFDRATQGGDLILGDSILRSAPLRRLVDGTELLNLKDLEHLGAMVVIAPSGEFATVARGLRRFTLMRFAKRVEVSLPRQQLRAWEGSRLVLQTKVSTGRNNRTPAGSFTAGPYKARSHYSKRYDNAPMPWSVQVTGHVFIHGFRSVPDYPASHGCIRVPLTNGNPARFFYEWVERGTPIRIHRDPETEIVRR